MSEPLRHPHIPFFTDNPYEWLATVVTMVCHFGEVGEGASRAEDRTCSQCGVPMFVNYVSKKNGKQVCHRCFRKNFDKILAANVAKNRHPCATPECDNLTGKRAKLCVECHKVWAAKRKLMRIADRKCATSECANMVRFRSKMCTTCSRQLLITRNKERKLFCVSL